MAHSDYWLQGQNTEGVNLASRGSDIEEVIRLAQLKRALSNFVKIFTKRAIPVKFSSGDR